MSFTALDLTRKAGDLIKCEDWNKSMQEIERLGRDKVDSVDGALSGTLSIDEKLTIRSAENNLLIDSTKEGELSMKTGRQSDQLIFGNGENRALTIRENRVGIGMDDPREMLDVNGHAKATPIMAQWYPGGHGGGVAGHHLVHWDTEAFNTNPDYLQKIDGNRIAFKKAGYYQVSAIVLIEQYHAGSSCHSYLRKNNHNVTDGQVLDLAHGPYYFPRNDTNTWDDRHNEYAGYFEEGEFVSVNVHKNHTWGQIYHHGPIYTRLTITRLN